jgi:hypothetical protein
MSSTLPWCFLPYPVVFVTSSRIIFSLVWMHLPPVIDNYYYLYWAIYYAKDDQGWEYLKMLTLTCGISEPNRTSHRAARPRGSGSHKRPLVGGSGLDEENHRGKVEDASTAF